MSDNSANSPFADALAAWHMAGDGDAAAGTLSIEGAVQLGVELTGAERAASLARGGNGCLAVFDGGYLRVPGLSAAAGVLHGSAMSFCMRVRDATGLWDAPLFGRDDPDDPLGAVLYGTDGAAKPLAYRSRRPGRGAATPYYHLFAEQGGPQRRAGSKALLEYRWRTEPVAAVIQFCERSDAGETILADARNGVLTVGVPVALVGPSVWHDVVFRFAGPILELFVDGVLVDEEWGYGSLHRFVGPFLIGAAWEGGELRSGFHGQVDHVALWERALSDAEIAQLSGGSAAAARRAVEILGPEPRVPHYWRPRGYNTYAGDCMLLWDGDRLHLFYLFDRRHHTSKWNLGAHQYSHLSTSDLSDWQRHPLAVPLSHTWECAIGTGDFLHHQGRYHAFYTDCGGRCQFADKPHQGSGVFHATSGDGIHYHKEPFPVVPTTDHGCADCSIFHDEQRSLFHLLTQDRAPDGTPQVVHYQSTDLSTWRRQPEPFLDPGIMGACPHLFAWHDWYYFAMGNRVWKARSPAGPWAALNTPPLVGLNYPKTTPFTGSRLLAAGWIGHAGWGGDLLFREMVQFADGGLGSRFVREMIPPRGAPLALTPEALSGELGWDGVRLRLAAPRGPQAREATALVAEIPANVRITLGVEPEGAAVSMGLTDREGRGVEVQIEPSSRRVSVTGPLDRFGDGAEHPVLEPVADLDRPFAVDLIVNRGIVDLCVDQRHTLVARRSGPAGRQLRFTVRTGAAVFCNPEIRPLADPPCLTE